MRLAEALAVLDALKAPGPRFLSNLEKHRAGEMARIMTPKVRVDDAARPHVRRGPHPRPDQAEAPLQLLQR